MREIICPVCGSEVPRMLLHSKTFPCPTCKEWLRVKGLSPLLIIPLVACGYWLAFVTAERVGLKGNELLIVTLLSGPFVTIPLGSVLGVLLAWVFRIPPRLLRGPGPRSSDGGILHID